MPASLSDAFRQAMTPEQRALALSRIRAGEQVACGSDYDRLRVNGKMSVAGLACGATATDTSHDDEAIHLTEKLIRFCGCIPFQQAYLSKSLLSNYFRLISESNADAIVESLVEASRF